MHYFEALISIFVVCMAVSRQHGWCLGSGPGSQGRLEQVRVPLPQRLQPQGAEIRLSFIQSKLNLSLLHFMSRISLYKIRLCGFDFNRCSSSFVTLSVSYPWYVTF